MLTCWISDDQFPVYEEFYVFAVIRFFPALEPIQPLVWWILSTLLHRVMGLQN